MTSEKDEAEIRAALIEWEAAAVRLEYLIHTACPQPHIYHQHRDRNPPWCPTCRRTAAGTKIPRSP